MGTRGLTKVIYKGQTMVAQYGQWDHYLEGQGKTIQDFLKTMDRLEFEKNLELCNFITDKEVDSILADRPAKFDNYEDESAWYELVAPELIRDTGAGILKLIQDAPRVLQNQSNFSKDRVFCEGIFELNFDKHTVQFKIPNGKNTKKYTFTQFVNLNLDIESKNFYDRE
jgi:hypothetical protein